MVGATDWFGLGSLSFLHWKKKCSMSHPSQWNLNGCTNTKMIHCCLRVPVPKRALPSLFYKLIYTGNAWKEKKTFLYCLDKGAKLQHFKSSLGHWYDSQSMKSHISRRCIYMVFDRLRENVICSHINLKSSIISVGFNLRYSMLLVRKKLKDIIRESQSC